MIINTRIFGARWLSRPPLEGDRGRMMAAQTGDADPPTASFNPSHVFFSSFLIIPVIGRWNGEPRTHLLLSLKKNNSLRSLFLLWSPLLCSALRCQISPLPALKSFFFRRISRGGDFTSKVGAGRAWPSPQSRLNNTETRRSFLSSCLYYRLKVENIEIITLRPAQSISWSV